MMMNDYKYSLEDIENMIAFERIIYLTHIRNAINETSDIINQT